MTWDIVLCCIKYIVDASHFWPAMGSTTALGMFIGAIIYDGHITQVRKGVVTILTYAGMLLWVITSRVIETLPQVSAPERALASIVSIIFVTIAWILGVFLGVMVLNLKHKE